MGFDACGIASARKADEKHIQALEDWLGSNGHGSMQYMDRNRELRTDPDRLMPGVRSIVCLAFNYHQKDFQPADCSFRISQYAAGVDYHVVIKTRLHQLMEQLMPILPAETAFRVFTDSAPVLEKFWATQAGLGAMGKNSCLIIPGKGSYFFLAEIFLNIELEYDKPFARDLCGKCTRCMEACPTSAITAPGKVHAPLCLSYQTIEKKDPVSPEVAPHLNGFVFGCDICQDVCPHNQRFARPCAEQLFQPLPAIQHWGNQEWQQMDIAVFNKNFRKTKSPLARAGFPKLCDTIRKVKKD